VCFGVLLGFAGQGASKQISLHTAETAMPLSFALQSPISKEQWHKTQNSRVLANPAELLSFGCEAWT